MNEEAAYWKYYEAKLKWLDLHIMRLLAAREARGTAYPLDELRGVVVTEAEVQELLAQEQLDADALNVYTHHIHRQESVLHSLAAQGMIIPLHAVAAAFSLTPFEQNCLFLCLAVQLNRKYEKLYGYLLDDITCKWPTPDLAMQLFCQTATERFAVGKYFAKGSNLEKIMLWSTTDPEEKHSWLSRPLGIDERMFRFLTSHPSSDVEHPIWMRVSRNDQPLEPIIDDLQVQHTLLSSRQHLREGEQLAYHLYGPSGSGKKFQLLHAFHSAGQQVLFIDAKRFLEEEDVAKGICYLLREAQLQAALLCVDHWEWGASEVGLQAKKRQQLLEGITAYSGSLAILSEQKYKPHVLLAERCWVEIELSIPSETQREQLWRLWLTEYTCHASVDAGVLAGKFRFTPGQIRKALKRAGDTARLEQSSILPKHLYDACYAQVRHALDLHATPIIPRASWDDLILPDEQIHLLQQACNQVTYRHVVYGEWGFGQKLSYGKGISMLFTGPPGTGKTMSAEVIAHELHLEIYKIDLSQVISKYIGETEKNLHKIFAEAKAGNVILFFDEADALFGKRSEVKDSHDKFANVETAYLLQKMEEHEGISILATNLMQNFDDAFLRRINYVVKYPLPDAEYREKIWRSFFPAATPQSSDLDFSYLASKLQIAGGSIKNIVLASAFLAAANQTPVGMRHIVTAAKQELRKSGKLLLKEDLQEYDD